MSALRVPGPDGRIMLIDQGPSVARLHGMRATNTGPAVVHGTMAFGESEADAKTRKEREYKQRWLAKKKAAGK